MEIEEGGDEAGNESPVEEEPLVPDIITDDFFEELCNRGNSIIRDLQGDQQYELAEDFQRTLMTCQNLRGTLDDERVRFDEMTAEVADAATRVANAMAISKRDQETMETLREDIENAWKQSDAAQTREQAAQDLMHTMRAKMERLQKDAAKYSDKKDATEDLGPSLSKHKEGILRERDRLSAEVEELNRRLQIQRLYSDEMEKKRTEVENKNKELYKMLDDTSDEAFKEKRFLDNLKTQVNELSMEKVILTDDAQALKAQIDVQHKTMAQQNGQIVNARANIEKLSQQNAVCAGKLTKASGDLEELLLTKDKLTYDLSVKTNVLKLKDDENNKYRLELGKLTKWRESLMKKLMNVESNKSILEQEVMQLKNIILTFEKEQDASKKAFDKARKHTETIVRERDLVRKELARTNKTITEHSETIALHEQHIKTLEIEIKGHTIAAQKQKALIAKIEKDRDRNADEVLVLADKVEQMQEEILLRQNQIAELKEKLVEYQMKLVQLQSLFEATRTERNTFQRDLQSCVEDRDDVKERLQLSGRQNEQLKEDIVSKEADLLKANKHIDKLDKDKQSLKHEIQQTLVTLQHTRTELKEKSVENERLYKTLSDDEARFVKMNKQIDDAQNEKDIIGTQLVRRNDDIALLNEKIGIIQLAIDRGEKQYNQRLDDIRLLKIEISNLRSQRGVLTRGLSNTADMRQEVLQTGRLLTQERVKVKALEQEMTTPMNIHRWRKLAGKDPDRLDLIFKVQSLQKRVLSQTIVAIDREQSIQESHKLYVALKQFMLKLPGHKVKERLNSTQHSLRARTQELKALTAELNAKEVDLREKDCAVQEIRDQLMEVKHKLTEKKKENTKLVEQHKAATHTPLPALLPGYRTIGAGFRLPPTD